MINYGADPKSLRFRQDMLANSMNAFKSCLSERKINDLETIERMFQSEVPASNPVASCCVTTHSRDQAMDK